MLDDMTRGYVTCALWASTFPESDQGDPLDDVYTTADFTPEALAAMRSDCAAFLDSCEVAGLDVTPYLSPVQMGHDLFLTRNGHGAGFWDRGTGELGEALTRLCERLPEAHVWPRGEVLDYEVL